MLYNIAFCHDSETKRGVRPNTPVELYVPTVPRQGPTNYITARQREKSATVDVRALSGRRSLFD